MHTIKQSITLICQASLVAGMLCAHCSLEAKESMKAKLKEKKQAPSMKNIAINPKDYPEIELQDDTIREGATWDPNIHGYPHASANSRMDMEHGEHNMIDGDISTIWQSANTSTAPQWIRVDLGKDKVFDHLKITVPEPLKAPNLFKIDVSSDNFKEDVRNVFNASKTGTKNWNKDIKFRPVLAKSVRLTITEPDSANFAVGEFEIYPAAVRSNTNVWCYTPKKEKASFIYDNPDNLAFNPYDAPEDQWKAEINGYPHVTASGYAKGRPGRPSFYPHYVIDGEFIMARSWTHDFMKWWGNWLKIDFGKEIEFKYIKVFSTCMWIISGEPNRSYIPGKFDIEISDDNFQKDIRKVFSVPPGKTEDIWNYQKNDCEKIIALPEMEKARYIRFNFPEGQYPSRRLLIEQIEIYKTTPPKRKIEKEITNKPKLGSKVSAPILAETPDFTVWLEGSTRKVFKSDKVIKTAVTPVVELSAARNENESFQIVVQPQKDLKKVSLKFSDLQSRDGKIFSKNNITWNPVGYAYIFDPSIINAGGSRNIMGKKGDWPDQLLDQTSIDTRKATNAPLWVNVFVPTNTSPGLYQGKISILVDGEEYSSIKLVLNVRNFTLPDNQQSSFFRGTDPGLRFMLPYYQKAFDGKWSQEEVAVMVYENLAKHRVNMLFGWPFPPQYQPDVKIKDGKVVIDTAKFDSLMEILIDKLGFKFLPFPTAQTHDILGSRAGYPWEGFAYMSDDYKKYLLGKNGYLSQMSKHLAEKGWLDKFFLEIWHEPQCGKDIDAWKTAYELGKMIKAINPNIKLRIGGTCLDWNKTCPELFSIIDAWGVYMAASSLDKLHDLKANENTTITTSFNGFWLVDAPAINCRIMPWLLWKAKVDGYLHYGIFPYVNSWKNSRSFPMANTSGSVRNGDCQFLYPQRRTNTEKPYIVDSIRWELEREGAEDYEYFKLLDDKIKKLEKLDKNNVYKEQINKAKKALSQAESLVTDFGKADKDSEMSFEFVEDPQKLYQARETMGDQIEKLTTILKEVE